jgi:hypothetical protein
MTSIFKHTKPLEGKELEILSKLSNKLSDIPTSFEDVYIPLKPTNKFIVKATVISI